MTEPDFDQIARHIANYFSTDLSRQPALDPFEALREVWNARGAADAAKLQALDVLDHGDLVVRVFTGAIKALDR